jgi:mRNA interferase MazF
MEVKRGDVVLMVVPGELGRPRPGVIVQADELGQNTTTVLTCPLSSDVQTSPNPRLRPLVEPASGNGLHVRSQVMTDKLFAQRRERIRRVIGSIDAKTRSRLDAALLIVLGFGARGA